MTLVGRAHMTRDGKLTCGNGGNSRCWRAFAYSLPSASGLGGTSVDTVSTETTAETTTTETTMVAEDDPDAEAYPTFVVVPLSRDEAKALRKLDERPCYDPTTGAPG